MRQRTLVLLAVTTLAVACNTKRPGGGAVIRTRPDPRAETTDPLAFHAPARVVAAGVSSLLSASSPRVRSAALGYPEKQAPEAPLSLTASDGTGLQLVALNARAVLDGPLAFTELRLAFQNPQDRELEGRFSITLPENAAISRFAMRLGQKWQEAEVVERQAARQTYESFLHRRQDPALLEQEAGNAFRARVFPIPPRGVKELMISYSEELADTGRPYRLHLKGLPQIPRLTVTALVGHRATTARPATSLGGTITSRQVVRVDRRGWKPDQDFELAVPGSRSSRPSGALRGEAAGSIEGLGHGDLVVARISPTVPNRLEPIDSLLVLVDTSASRAAGFATQVETLGALVTALANHEGTALALKVACFDQSVAPVFEGTAGGFGPGAMQRILARRALGASNLHGALEWAAGVKGHRRLLLMTDGVQTAGQTDGHALRRAVAGLKPRFDRVDVVLVGGIRDESLMRRLTTDNSLARDGSVLEGTLGSEELVRKLTRRSVSGIEVQVPRARWVWPTVLNGMQPGSQVLVYASVPVAARRDGRLTVQLSGAVNETRQVTISSVERPLLERASAQARINRLIHRRDTLGQGDAATARAVQKRIIALSTRYRILSDYTALLVLETEWDYRRFNIDRRSLTDILTVGSDGVAVRRRKWEDVVTSGRGVAHKVVTSGRGVAHKGEEEDRGSRIASIFGRDSALGVDAEDALGGLIGNQIGESYGVGGLGLSGAGRGGGGSGRAHSGEEGKMGARRSGLHGLRGPADNPDPHLARRIAEDSAASAGVLGLLRGPSGHPGRAAAFVGQGGLSAGRAHAPTIRTSRPTVRGALSAEIIRRIVRRHINEVRYCYQVELQANPRLAGRMVVQFTIAATGQVVVSRVQTSTFNNSMVESCVAQAVRRWLFPKPAGGGVVVVSYPFTLVDSSAGPDVGPPAAFGAAAGVQRVTARRPAAPQPPPPPPAPSPADRLVAVQGLLKQGQAEQALVQALRWRAAEPGDVLALVALGEALGATGRTELAVRAYGSIIDLYPSRADMRRFAGQRLESLSAEMELASDTYSVAVQQRPDHPVGHRLLAYALLRQGQPARAFVTLESGLTSRFAGDRFLGVRRVLREDLGLVGAAWIREEPSRAPQIRRRLAKLRASLPLGPSLRFVLHWETDTNDVDLHVHDAKGNHAFYQRRQLPTGGVLYEDVTTGYGPECFAIAGEARAFPYRLAVHYYSRGPMGYGMGKVQVIHHDGKGKLRFEDRPFVVLQDGATVDLGLVKRL